MDKNARTLKIPQKYTLQVKDFQLSDKQIADLNIVAKKAYMSIKPWAYIIAGGLAFDVLSGISLLIACVDRPDKVNWIFPYCVFLIMQTIAVAIKAENMATNERRLKKMVNDIIQSNQR